MLLSFREVCADAARQSIRRKKESRTTTARFALLLADGVDGVTLGAAGAMAATGAKGCGLAAGRLPAL